MQGDWGGPIKIGVAGNPIHRHNILQTGYPYKLLIVSVIEGDREAELHERFCAHRLYGEWFDPHKEVVDGIREVLAEHINDPFRSHRRFCRVLSYKGWTPEGYPLAGPSCRKRRQPTQKELTAALREIRRDTLRKSPLPAPAPRKAGGGE